jgi:hypothetical protein
MHKQLLLIFGAMTLAAGWPAFAGPDFQAIEKSRATKQVAHSHRVDSNTGQRVSCPPEALVLPLDHGPRAQTTPGENRVRKARYEAQIKACSDSVS